MVTWTCPAEIGTLPDSFLGKVKVLSESADNGIDKKISCNPFKLEVSVIAIKYNGDIWQLQEHELIQFLKDRIEQYNVGEIVSLEFAGVGENLGPVVLEMSDQEDEESIADLSQALLYFQLAEFPYAVAGAYLSARCEDLSSKEMWDNFCRSAKEYYQVDMKGVRGTFLIFKDGSAWVEWKHGIDQFYEDVEDLFEEYPELEKYCRGEEDNSW